MFNGITFLHKEYLWFLLVIIPLTVWYILRLKKANPSLHISTAQAFKTIKPGLKVRLRHSLFFLRMIVLAC
ncbi:MAG: aerotolerance regulator BatA, partial [Bacteroidales bacterium]|nr:aerotolerance regulator BatA [Bacteroidales bacterium]